MNLVTSLPRKLWISKEQENFFDNISFDMHSLYDTSEYQDLLKTILYKLFPFLFLDYPIFIFFLYVSSSSNEKVKNASISLKKQSFASSSQ